MMVWLSMLLFASALQAGEIRGKVIDGLSGEPLARARVLILGSRQIAETAGEGSFIFQGLAEGQFVLRAETVGYRVEERSIQLGGDPVEIEFRLVPDNLTRRESLEVKADRFEVPQAADSAAWSLTGTELRNLSSVLMDDPLRAAQSLPGVVANNDYYSQFSVFGAAVSQVGIYLDGLLLHAPYHTMQGIRDSGSMSNLNGDMIEDLAVLPAAYPARYGDRAGAVLDVRGREGSRQKRTVRATAGMVHAGVQAESPFARGRGTWLAGVRQSYAQYITRRLTDDTTQAVGFFDAQGRVTYRAGQRHAFTIHGLGGKADYDRETSKQRPGLNTLVDGEFRSNLGRAAWDWSPASRTTIQTQGAWIDERFDNLNRDNLELGTGSYGEWVVQSGVSQAWEAGSILEAGFSARRIRGSGTLRQYNSPTVIRSQDSWNGKAWRQGFFVQNRWSRGPLSLTAGLRGDGMELGVPTVFSPTAGASLRFARGWSVQAGFGQYTQYPDISAITSASGGAWLLAERSSQFLLGIERRFGPSMRFRVEGYQRTERDRIARPGNEGRMVDGRVVLPQFAAPYYNSVRAYARGLNAVLQLRSASRLSGWLSYGYGVARARDGVLNVHYWSDDDQRHTAGAAMSYRLRPGSMVSGRWAYGSGQPIPGFFRQEASGAYFLAATRNDLRLPSYRRADVRWSQSWIRDRWKFTLYAEVVNLTNHRNIRLASVDSIDPRTGRVSLTFQRVFPIIPAAGIAFEF
jgi:hypothetical protein